MRNKFLTSKFPLNCKLFVRERTLWSKFEKSLLQTVFCSVGQKIVSLDIPASHFGKSYKHSQEMDGKRRWFLLPKHVKFMSG